MESYPKLFDCQSEDSKYESNDHNYYENNIIINNGFQELETIVQNQLFNSIKKLNGFLNPAYLSIDGNDNAIDQYTGKKYKFPLNKIGGFFDNLNICRKDPAITSLHWCERQNPNASGIMIDIDIHQKTNIRIIDASYINLTVQYVSNILKNIINDNTDLNFKIIITQKDKPTEYEQIYKDGFHILIPEIWINRSAKGFILEELTTLLRKKNYLEADVIVDKASKYVPVLFLGSTKRNITAIAYSITYIFDIKINSENNQTMIMNEYDQLDKLEKKYNMVYELSLNQYFETLNGNPTYLNKRVYNIPMFKDNDIDDNRPHPTAELTDEEMKIEDSVNILSMNDAEAKYMKNLLSLIDIKFAEDYDLWTRVIWAIANTDQRYKPLAYWFSLRCPKKYSQKAVDDIWEKARLLDTPVTKRSLVYWAKESNPEKFKEIMDNYYQTQLLKYAFENDGIIEHSSVSKILWLMLEDKFVTDKEPNIERGEKIYWFEFIVDGQDHIHGEIYKWRREKNPTTLQLYIADHLPKVFRNVEKTIKEFIDKEPDEIRLKWYNNVLTTFKKYRHSLGNDSTQTSIIHQCIPRFLKRGFIQSLDELKDIIGVGNGILKLLPEPKLIKGFNEYRISISISADYIPYDPKNPFVIELENIFKNIFVEPDVYEKMMMLLSTGIDRRSVDPLLVMLVGGGSNGKSTIIEFMLNTLGKNFGYKAPAGLLLEYGSKANEANSAQFNMKNKTVIFYDESDPGQKINTKRLKDVTSPTQTGRDLHKTQENYHTSAIHFYMSNYKAIVDTTDHGTWRRIYFYATKAKFTANPDPKNKYEKIANKKYYFDYPHNPEYQTAFLSILVHFNEILYNKYSYNVHTIPSLTIETETEEYRNENDTINKFINDCVIRSPHSDDYTINQIATRYAEWYSTQMGCNITYGIRDIIDRFMNSKLANLLTRIEGRLNMVLRGYRILNDEYDLLGDDEEYLFNYGLRKQLIDSTAEGPSALNTQSIIAT